MNNPNIYICNKIYYVYNNKKYIRYIYKNICIDVK